jgi:hypothetical protein
VNRRAKALAFGFPLALLFGAAEEEAVPSVKVKPSASTCLTVHQGLTLVYVIVGVVQQGLTSVHVAQASPSFTCSFEESKCTESSLQRRPPMPPSPDRSGA